MFGFYTQESCDLRFHSLKVVLFTFPISSPFVMDITRNRTCVSKKLPSRSEMLCALVLICKIFTAVLEVNSFERSVIYCLNLILKSGMCLFSGMLGRRCTPYVYR